MRQATHGFNGHQVELYTLYTGMKLSRNSHIMIYCKCVINDG